MGTLTAERAGAPHMYLISGRTRLDPAGRKPSRACSTSGTGRHADQLRPTSDIFTTRVVSRQKSQIRPRRPSKTAVPVGRRICQKSMRYTTRVTNIPEAPGREAANEGLGRLPEDRARTSTRTRGREAANEGLGRLPPGGYKEERRDRPRVAPFIAKESNPPFPDPRNPAQGNSGGNARVAGISVASWR